MTADEVYSRMSASELDLPIGMGAVGVLSRASSLLRRDLRVSLAVWAGSAALLVPLLGPFVFLACLGVGFGFADEALGYSPSSTSFLRRFVDAILTTILSGVVVALGLVVFLAPGIYLAIRFFLVIPAIWIRDAGPVGALEDSWDLTTGKTQATLGVGVFLLGMAVAVALVVELAVFPAVPVNQLGEMAVLSGPYPRLRFTFAVVGGVVGPLATATLSVMYRGFPYP
ncbi:MAG: hypothetical protein ACOCP3_03375 [Halodesulfurarchaeum sp.]